MQNFQHSFQTNSAVHISVQSRWVPTANSIPTSPASETVATVPPMEATGI